MKEDKLSIVDLLSVSSCALTLCSILKMGFLCYELGRDESDTFVWEVIGQGIEAYATVFICVLGFLMARNVKKKIVFEKANMILLKLAGSAVLFAGLLYYIVEKISPLESENNSLLFLLLGTFILFIGHLFKIGIRLKEEQDLTV